MSVAFLDYTLDKLVPTNPDGSLPAAVAGCAVVAGPGAIAMGNFPAALDFSAGGQLTVALARARWNDVKLCVRVVFRVGAAVTSRQALAASNAVPLSLALLPSGGTSAFSLVASITTGASGAGSASTQYHVDLQTGTWYTVDLVYDTDTLAVFVDDVVYSVHAFPAGTLAAAAGDQLVAGVGLDGVSDPFAGEMAVLQVHDDIPAALETQLDERRNHPQWFLTYKEEEIKGRLSFGAPSGDFFYDAPSLSWIQDFANGRIMYHDGNGQAFEMHSALLAAYRAMAGPAQLGYLISDEIPAAKSGSRKNLFSRGGIYWSGSTGAMPVIGQIWVDYEGMGESGAIGLPTAAATAVPGGLEQVFQGARMYQKTGAAKAFEVHGAILAKYISSGGPGTWGMPVSNEEDLVHGGATIGRTSEFEKTCIYWSSHTGAFEVHDAIRRKYTDAGGPGGQLGFPTSDGAAIPGASGAARYNTFEHGSITWFGSDATTYLCLPFDIHLGTIDSEENEGFGRGQNDIYLHATFTDNGHVIHTERVPGSGDSDGHNVWSPERTFNLGSSGIVPNSPSRNIVMTLDIWDSDAWDDDDHLGVYSYELCMANAWGLRDAPYGVFDSGAFDCINNIRWSLLPRIDESLLTEANKWWGCTNQGTPSLRWDQYAAAFRDVDSETEWYDPTDWLAKLFYDAVVEGIAKNGNCFGMSLEAIYSKKHRSLLGLPLDRFDEPSWPVVSPEFNIKHQYQVGAAAIWWFVSEFLTGRTHNPVMAFLETDLCALLGSDPVLCISQNYDFSGAPHCILPVKWDTSVTPWQIHIHDPNFPTRKTNDPGPRILTVNQQDNTFHYDGAGSSYDGGEWSGGRLHYMPFFLLNEEPRTPIFEALMLLISGLILILGSDSETASLTDENGVDLNAFGADSVARLQAGQPLTNKFVQVKAFDQTSSARPPARPKCPPAKVPPKKPPHAFPPRDPRPHGVLTSEVHLRCEPRAISTRTPPRLRGTDWTRLTLKEYLCQWAPAPIREQFDRQKGFVALNQGRLMYHLMDLKVVKGILGGARVTPPPASAGPPVTPNFIHTIRAVRGGQLMYGLKQGMTQFLLSADATPGEQHVLKVRDLGAQNSAIRITGSHDTTFSLVVHNRLGAGSDHLRITVEGIPFAASGALDINIKPGIGGVELVSAGQPIDATVSFEYQRGRESLSSRFAVSLQDGLRIIPSTFITNNQLKVSRINSLFGGALNSMIVRPLA